MLFRYSGETPGFVVEVLIKHWLKNASTLEMHLATQLKLLILDLNFLHIDFVLWKFLSPPALAAPMHPHCRQTKRNLRPVRTPKKVGLCRRLLHSACCCLMLFIRRKYLFQWTFIKDGSKMFLLKNEESYDLKQWVIPIPQMLKQSSVSYRWVVPNIIFTGNTTSQSDSNSHKLQM